MDRDFNGRPVFDLSVRAQFSAESVICAESRWFLFFRTQLMFYDSAVAWYEI